MNRSAYVVECPHDGGQQEIVAGPLSEREAAEEAAENEHRTGLHTIVAAADVVKLALEHGEDVAVADEVDL